MYNENLGSDLQNDRVHDYLSTPQTYEINARQQQNSMATFSSSLIADEAIKEADIKRMLLSQELNGEIVTTSAPMYDRNTFASPSL